MGIGKQGAARSKSVDVRGDGVWPALHAANPIVEIIDGDHQDVGTLVRQGRVDGKPQHHQNHFGGSRKFHGLFDQMDRSNAQRMPMHASPAEAGSATAFLYQSRFQQQATVAEATPTIAI